MTDIQTRQPTPVLSLRDVVVFPHMVIPLFVARERSVKALEETMNGDKKIVLVTQKQSEIEEPQASDLYEIGTIASILQMLRLPDGTTKVLVEGLERIQLSDVSEPEGFLAANWVEVEGATADDDQDIDVTVRGVMDLFEQYVKLSRKVPPELMTTLSGIEDPSRLADTIAAHLGISIEDKQSVLEISGVLPRLERLMGLIEGEMDVLKLEKRIRGRVKTQMEKSQREYYLNEQMKAIQKELGDLDETGTDLGDLENKIAKAGMPKEALEKAQSELTGC
jgi:ATP-dependent Lon protease